jgi:hypothetical protein
MICEACCYKQKLKANTYVYTSKRRLTEHSFKCPREQAILIESKSSSDRLLKHHGSVLDFAIPGEILRARVIYAAASLNDAPGVRDGMTDAKKTWDKG